MIDTQNKSRRGILRLLWIVAILAVSFTLIKYSIVNAYNFPVSIAFCTYYNAARDVADDRNPYAFRETPDIYCYPLFLSALLVPICQLSYPLARIIWYAGNWIALLLIVTVILLWRQKTASDEDEQSKGAARERGWIAILFCASYVPLLYTYCDGQIDLWVTALVVVAFYLARFGRETWAGVLVAAAILLKIAPIIWLPGLLFILKKRGFLAVVLVGLIYQIIIVSTGWWRWETYLIWDILPRWQYQKFLPSFSLYHAALNWAGHWGYPVSIAEEAAGKIFLAGRIFAIICYVLLMIIGKIKKLPGTFVAGLTLIISFYFFSILELNHLIWIVIPVSVGLIDKKGRPSLLELISVVVVWILGIQCFESNQSMGFWWGFQIGLMIPLAASALYFFPGKFKKA